MVAAAAAATYAFTGERGKQNRKRVAMWVKRMEAEAIAKLKEMQVVSKDKYDEVVDLVKAKYQAMRDLDPQEVALAALQLKKHWTAIKEEMKDVIPTGEKAAKPKRKKASAK